MADLINAIVWMVSSFPPNSKSYSFFNNPSEIVPRTPNSFAATITFELYSFFFMFSSKDLVLIYLFASFYFHSAVCWDGSFIIDRMSFNSFIIFILVSFSNNL